MRNMQRFRLFTLSVGDVGGRIAVATNRCQMWRLSQLYIYIYQLLRGEGNHREIFIFLKLNEDFEPILDKSGGLCPILIILITHAYKILVPVI